MFAAETFLIYAALWAGFGLGHSALAAPAVKARLHRLFGAGYRLAYNIFAAVHFGAVYHLGGRLYAPARAFDIPEALGWGMVAAQVIGVLVLVAALREYDLGLFAGTKQLRRARAGRDAEPVEPLATAGLHAHMRHPLYTGLLLIVWGRVGTDFDLATATLASAYLAVGIWSEERKLLAVYGAGYAAYRAAVPALVPWRRPRKPGTS